MTNNLNKSIAIFIIIILTLFLLLILYKRNSKVIVKKIIWCYWNKNTPDPIKKMVDNNRKILYDWDIRFLNDDTLKLYIKDSEFPSEYKDLGVQSKADYIRLLLLKKYGGCWVDSSTIINDKKYIDNLYNKIIKNKYQLVSCHWKGEIDIDTQKKLNTPNLYIENWFLMAPKNSTIIKLWFEEFDKALKIGFLNYKEQLYEDGVEIIDMIYTKDNDNTYLTMHACLQKVLQKRLNKFPNDIYLVDATKSFFKMQTECDWECECMKKKFKNKKYMKNIPVIKFVGHNRECLGI